MRLPFISRNTYSPAFPIPGNTVDRTPGFYGHTPKWWSCRDEDWDPYEHHRKFSRDVGEEPPDWMFALMREQAAAHAHCRWPYRHLSYGGYVCLIFPRKGRLTLYYWGRSPNPTHRRLDWQPDYRRRLGDRDRVYKQSNT